MRTRLTALLAMILTTASWGATDFTRLTNFMSATFGVTMTRGESHILHGHAENCLVDLGTNGIDGQPSVTVKRMNPETFEVTSAHFGVYFDMECQFSESPGQIKAHCLQRVCEEAGCSESSPELALSRSEVTVDGLSCQLD